MSALFPLQPHPAELEGRPSVHSVQSLKPDLWGSYLGSQGDLGEDDDCDVCEPEDDWLHGVSHSSQEQEQEPSVCSRPSLDCRPRVFDRLYQHSGKSRTTSLSGSVDRPFTPKLNEHSLRLAERVRSRSKVAESESVGSVRSFVPTASLRKPSSRSQTLLLSKFAKELAHILKLLSLRLAPFDPRRFTL